MVITSQDCDFDASRVGIIRGAYIAPIPLLVLATSLRLTVKLRKTNGNKITLDDLLIVFATVRALVDDRDTSCYSGLTFPSDMCSW